MAIMENAVKMEKEELRKVDGGYLYDTHYITSDGNGPPYVVFEVIDDKTGETLYVGKGYDDAYRYAKRHGIGTRGIDTAAVNRLRETGHI